MGRPLPEPLPLFGAYLNVSPAGNLLFSAGHLPVGPEGLVTGRLGRELDVTQGCDACGLAALSLLATLRDELGDLSRVERLVHLLVLIQSTEDFVDHTTVADGASEIFINALGDGGKAPRMSASVVSLVANAAVEIQAVVLVRGDHSDLRQ